MRLFTPTRAVKAVVVLAVAVALVAAAVAGASSTKRTAGGTATLALPPGTTPDFIFPLVDGAHYSVANIEQFQRLMWRPLYLYRQERPAGPRTRRQEPRADARLHQGNKRVTITMKHYIWSDGKPVTSRDFTFLLTCSRRTRATGRPTCPVTCPTTRSRSRS